MALSKLKPNSFHDTVEGNPSLIINGDMAVAQRGSQSAQQTGYSAVDRFKMQGSSAARFGTSQSTDVPSGQGFSNSLKLDCSTADTSLSAGDFQQVKTILEGQDLQHLLWGTSSASNLTLTFWVKSPKTGTHNLEIEHTDASQKNTIQYSITTANTWQKVTLKFDGYQTTNFNNDNGASLVVTWWLMSGTTYGGGTYNENTWHNTNANRAVGQVNVGDSTSNDFYLTGVKLEVGDTATPFQHESYMENLQKCKRYFYRAQGGGGSDDGLGDTYTRFCGGNCHKSIQAQGAWQMPVEMRDEPTLSPVGATNLYAIYHANTVTVCNSTITRGSSGANRQSIGWAVGSTGLTIGRACELITNNVGSLDASIDFSAEL